MALPKRRPLQHARRTHDHFVGKRLAAGRCLDASVDGGWSERPRLRQSSGREWCRLPAGWRIECHRGAVLDRKSPVVAHVQLTGLWAERRDHRQRQDLRRHRHGRLRP